jgi:hypothetical protein
MAQFLDPKGVGAPDFVRELRPSIYSIETDPLLVFTDELIQDAVEREDIIGLRTNKARLSEAIIQADQQLHLQLLFYSSYLMDESDISADTFLGAVEFDLSLYGIQQTTSQWRMSLTDVNIDLLDDDETKTIHVILKNLDSTTKNAGDTGEVKVTFVLEARS